MAKSVAVFMGVDSACRHIHVAYRADGVAFDRSYGNSRFGGAWSKWQKTESITSLSKALETGKVDWGFKTLSGGPYEHCRLPST
jgi:hypothetical protein